jgi:ATP-binding cassette subfamily A (ABC1) protein 3
MVLLYLSYIPFTMTLSTFFTDSKVANYVGGLLMIFPIIIFLQFLIMDSNSKYLIYLFYLLPIFPSCGIFVKLTSISEEALGFDVPDNVLLNTDFISTPVSWLFLMLSIPFWFGIYLYLDNVMPNTYGV